MKKDHLTFYVLVVLSIEGCKKELMSLKEIWLEAPTVTRSSARESRRILSLGKVSNLEPIASPYF